MLTAVRNFLELIKFKHTIFALPFAYIGMLIAAQGHPTWWQFGWITVAMASARTVAMGVNRIADRFIDAANPRTARRPLVSGRISLRTAWIGTGAAALLLVYAAWSLGPLPLRWLPLAMCFLIGYSYTKRFTWLSHWILGFTDGLAPLGAWVAVRGSLFSLADSPGWLLLGIVTFWIAGFDLIYACQDADFDRRAGLHSVPARFGVAAALHASVASHGVMVLLLITLGMVLHWGVVYFAGVGIVIALLIYEHRLVQPDDLSRLGVAFFNMNSYISVTLFLTIWAALSLAQR